MIASRSCLLIAIVMLTATVIGAQDNPAILFGNLERQFSDPKETSINTPLSEGMSLTSFRQGEDDQKEYYLLSLYSSSGKTVYCCYTPDRGDTWYILKEAYFYNKPFVVEGSEIEKTYFVFKTGKPYAYNKQTGRYDITSDTDSFPAVVDVRTIGKVIETVVANRKSK